MRQTALVTGASRGLGREVAIALSQQGHRLLLGVRDRETAPALSAAVIEQLDLSSSASIDSLARRLSGRRETIDVLVNNAGINHRTSKEIWNVNVRGPLRLTSALAPLLSDGARVVMVSSRMGLRSDQDPVLLARLRAVHSLRDLDAICDEVPGDYGASKAAVVRLAELFAEKLRARRIRVNAVSPGWVRTDMGGPTAPRSVQQGAASIVWGCRLDAAGPTGGFFEDGQRLE